MDSNSRESGSGQAFAWMNAIGLFLVFGLATLLLGVFFRSCASGETFSDLEKERRTAIRDDVQEAQAALIGRSAWTEASEEGRVQVPIDLAMEKMIATLKGQEVTKSEVPVPGTEAAAQLAAQQAQQVQETAAEDNGETSTGEDGAAEENSDSQQEASETEGQESGNEEDGGDRSAGENN